MDNKPKRDTSGVVYGGVWHPNDPAQPNRVLTDDDPIKLECDAIKAAFEAKHGKP